MVLRVRTPLLVLCLFLAAASSAAPREAPRQPYLALGDSIAFGFIDQAGFEYVNPTNFIGFPDYVGKGLKLSATDAACPGETTGSFLSPTAPDDGCRLFRSLASLHVSYTATQADFATAYLTAHRQTRLVTVMLGANDLFLLEKACANNPTCIANGLPEVLATVSANMATILGLIRSSGFQGTIVIENYYSLDYSDAAATALTQALNQAVSAPAASYGALVADVFTDFQTAASNSFAAGNTCRAGLLNASPQNQFTCDVHPSQSGQQLIARAVRSAFAAALE